MHQEFIQKLTEIAEANLANEKFGIEELAKEMGMSRISLYRKFKVITNQTGSQFIRELRLKKARDLLLNEDFTVAEISYKVGFASPTYFNKCFHEYYGYPPGEVLKGNYTAGSSQDLIHDDQATTVKPSNKKRRVIVASILVFVVLISAVLIVMVKPFYSQQKKLEKSLVILPFLHYGPDTTNSFMSEGLREELINKLNVIKEIRVITRTTSDTYRNSNKTIKEIAKELRVNYILEGSTQTADGKTRIMLLLTDAFTEKMLWAKPFERIITEENIFETQQEIAELVANELKADISPEEKKKIATTGTENTTAYRYYVQGLSYWRIYNRDYNMEDLYKAKTLFIKALEQDSTYSLAMQELCWTLIFETWRSSLIVKKEKWDSAIMLADKAIKFDPQFSDAYGTKAFLTRHNDKERCKVMDMAIKTGPERPGGYDTYAHYYYYDKKDYANTIKYELKTCELIKDPIIWYMTLARLSISFAVTQFEVIAGKYNKLHFEMYNRPGYVSLLDQLNQIMSRNYQQAIEIGLQNLRIDSTDLTTLDYLGQSYLFLNDIEKADYYYNKYEKRIKTYPLNTFPVFPIHRSYFISTFLDNWPKNELLIEIFPVLHIMYIKKRLGNNELAVKYRKVILDIVDEMIKGKDEVVDFYLEDENFYLDMYFADYVLACLYATFGENDKAIEHIKNLTQREPKPVWLVNYVKDNPMLDPIREHPDFIRTVAYMEKEYDKEKKKIGKLIAEYQSIIP